MTATLEDLRARLEGPRPRPALAAIDARRAELETRITEPLVLELLSRRAIAMGEADEFARLCERRGLTDSFEYAQALRFAGRGEAAAAVVRHYAGDDPRLLREASFAALAEGDFLEAASLAQRSIDHATGSVALHARCLLALGLVERYRGRLAEGQDLAYRALTLPGLEDSVDVLLEALGYTTFAHFDRGQEDLARELLERARAVRDQAPESQWIIPALAEASLAHVERRFDEADVLYAETEQACVRYCFREVELRVLTCRAVLELERDRPEAAARHVATMRSRIEASGLFLLSIAADLLAVAVAPSRSDLARVLEMEELLPTRGLVARVFDALVLLVESRLPDPDIDAIAKRFARVHSRSEDGERWMDQSADLRGLLRAAERPLAALGVAAAPEAQPDALVLAADGAWFEIGEGQRFQLADRPIFRGILMCLAKARVERPGHTVPRESLFEAGWPGDRSAPSALTIRLRVAMTNLGAAARASRGGFLLDPNLAVSFARESSRLPSSR